MSAQPNTIEDTSKPRSPRLGRMTALLTAIYFLILVSLISSTLFREGEFETGREGVVKYTELWVNLLFFTYYILPVIIGIVYGMFFKPFLIRCRNVVITIFVIHLLYSFITNGLRYREFNHWREDIKKARVGQLNVRGLNHQFEDQSRDGFVDVVKFMATLDASQLPLGQYQVYFLLSQKGERLDYDPVGSYKLSIVQEGSNISYPKFAFNPQMLNEYFQKGPVYVDVQLTRQLQLREEAKDVLFFNRWAAFFRTTSWEGEDPYLYDREIEIAAYPRVGSFQLRPFEEERRQVRLEHIGEDFAQDADGNKLNDQLVIPFEVYSFYDGDVYISLLLNGRREFMVVQEQFLRKGLNRFQFIIDGQILLQFGQDGPYQLNQITVSNEDPACAFKECPKRIKSIFKEELVDYETKNYSLDNFE